MAVPAGPAPLKNVIVGAFDGVLAGVGFERVGALRWVRTRTSGIRDVLEAYGGRRGMRAVRWGVSLDFVPHLVGDAVRWHATATSARIDLGYEPHNFRDDWDFTAQAWAISPDLGFPTPEERAASIARAIPTSAYPWFEAITDLPSLTRAFEREEARIGGQFSFDNYVQHRLAYAFSLAKAGQNDRAITELQRWVARLGVAPRVEAELLAILPTRSGGIAER